MRFKCSRRRAINRRHRHLHLQCYMASRGRYLVLWFGLASLVGASHRVHLIASFSPGQNCPIKIATCMFMSGMQREQLCSKVLRYDEGMAPTVLKQYTYSFFAFILIQGTFFYCTDEEKKYEAECR